MTEDCRIVLFEKNGSVAALALYVDGKSGTLGFSGVNAKRAIHMIARGALPPVCNQNFDTRGEALVNFTIRVSESLRNGWQIIYHGEPNIG
ncbi:MAG TPA: hypothetical protein VIL74_20825 [Pyrinomonadaceae bacterium]|jgi:hypothetical protein